MVCDYAKNKWDSFKRAEEICETREKYTKWYNNGSDDNKLIIDNTIKLFSI